MKKRIVSIVLAATSFLSVGSLFACKKDETVETPKEIVLADFEQWAPDFQLIRVYNEFGRVTRNKDAAFVKSGKYSARLQPVGGYKKETQPTIVFPFESEKFAFDYRDISSFEEITCSFYNDAETEMTATIGFAKGISAEGVVITMGTEYALAPKAWTEIKHEVNCSFLSMLAEVDRIAGLYIQLPDTGVVYPEEAPSVYLDDVVIKTGAKQDVNPDFNLSTDNKTYIEIMDFENEYQKYYSMTDASETQAKVSIVSEDEVGIRASHGEKMLQVKNFNAKDTGEFNLYLRDSLMRAAGMTTVPVEYWKEVYFAFDVYMDCDDIAENKSWLRGYKTKAGDASQDPLGFVLYADDGVNANNKDWRMCKYGYTDASGVNIWELQQPKMEAYKWKTWRISLYELAFNRRNATDAEYVVDPGSFKISVPNSNDNKERNFYLDNFRLEHGPKVANGEPIIVIFG